MKTCKECKHFEVDTVSAVCEKKRWICGDDAPACNRFEQKSTTVFDRITQSPETLAEKFIFKKWHPVERHNVWYSLLLNSEDRFNCDPPFDTKEEALAATVARLKKEA